MHLGRSFSMSAATVRAGVLSLFVVGALFHKSVWGAQPFPILNAETRLAASGPVAISGDTVIAGGQVFVRGAEGWVFQQTLSSPDNVALDGNTAVIGTNIFVRSGNNWTLQGVLPSSMAYGRVAVSGDTIAIGQPFHSLTNGLYSGVVYVFTRTGSSWSTQAVLTPGDASLGIGFGSSVAVDGDRIVAGAPGIYAGYSPPPAAYIFTRTGTNWVQSAKLIDGSPDPGGFGDSVASSGDTVAVGESYQAAPVLMFLKTNGAWILRQKLAWSGGLASTGPYGNAVPMALNGNGFVALDNAGAVHIFSRGASRWSEQQTLTTGAGYSFGPTLGLGTNSVIVDAPVSGGSYVFESGFSQWQSRDIGAVGRRGGLAVSTNVITISGGGADIGGTTDTLQFVFRP